MQSDTDISEKLLAEQEEPEEEKSEESEEEKSCLIEIVSVDESLPEAPSTEFNYWFLCSVFLIYAAADGTWQAVDDALGNDCFTDELNGLEALSAWFLRCLLTGGGQVVAAWGMNEILAYFKCTDHWQRSEIVSSFLTGALWLPFTLLGKFIGGGLTLSGNPDSIARVIATSLSVATGNASTLSILKRLQPPKEINKKTPSMIADTASAIAFYLQEPLPEPRFWFFQPSSSGERTLPWTMFFSAVGAALGEATNALLNTYASKHN
ncbi:MAG: hypothetical protein SFW66_07175 [Gammaproteobacteria bacterium]|nr:hypothetical protein [Gammaproteobacteria bacterium]